MTDEDQEEEIEIAIRLNRAEAERLVVILKRNAKRDTNREYRQKFLEIIWQLKEEIGAPYTPTESTRRPRDDDEVALGRVIRGEGPYPVLSHADARRAFIALTDKLSASKLSERLHISTGSVFRWRREYRNGKWKEKDA